jgi:hypothetical protein
MVRFRAPELSPIACNVYCERQRRASAPLDAVLLGAEAEAAAMAYAITAAKVIPIENTITVSMQPTAI